MADLGKIIRAARRRARLSQAELASRAKTSQPAIARYESRAATPSIATLERILAACGDAIVIDVSRRSPRRQRGRALALVHQARERLLDAAERHGVRDLRLFGSAARGDDTPDSDIDFLVDLEPGRTLLDLIGFQQEAEDILGVSVDAAAPRLLKQRVRTRALREARAV
jgi:hypothetical protein